MHIEKDIMQKRQAQIIYDRCALLLNVTNLFEDSKERNNTDKLYKLSSAKNKKHKLLKDSQTVYFEKQSE
jgi:hypothetical protein